MVEPGLVSLDKVVCSSLSQLMLTVGQFIHSQSIRSYRYCMYLLLGAKQPGTERV